MKRILSAILCFCMLVCTLTVTVGAATVVNIFNLTVTAPVVGQKPSNTASLPATASTYVVSVRWEGEFDDQGRFMAGKDYTVYATVRVKEGLDKTISNIYTKLVARSLNKKGTIHRICWRFTTRIRQRTGYRSIRDGLYKTITKWR